MSKPIPALFKFYLANYGPRQGDGSDAPERQPQKAPFSTGNGSNLTIFPLNWLVLVRNCHSNVPEDPIVEVQVPETYLSSGPLAVPVNVALFPPPVSA
jgi:hypothetical protein